jgi:hypothetical protein
MRACLVWTIRIPQPAAVATREIGLAAAATRTVGAQAWRVGVRKTLHGTVVNAVQGRGKDTFFFLFPEQKRVVPARVPVALADPSARSSFCSVCAGTTPAKISAARWAGVWLPSCAKPRVQSLVCKASFAKCKASFAKPRLQSLVCKAIQGSSKHRSSKVGSSRLGKVGSKGLAVSSVKGSSMHACMHALRLLCSTGSSEHACTQGQQQA